MSPELIGRLSVRLFFLIGAIAFVAYMAALAGAPTWIATLGAAVLVLEITPDREYLFDPKVTVGRNPDAWHRSTMQLDALPPGFAAIVDCEGEIIMLVPDHHDIPEDWRRALNALWDLRDGRLGGGDS